MAFFGAQVKVYASDVIISTREGFVEAKISIYRDSLFLSSWLSRDSIVSISDRTFNRLRIESPGYFAIDTTFVGTPDRVIVPIQNKPIILNEVVVSARATLEDDGTTTTISHLSDSYIAEFGSLGNGLEWIPGLMKLESGKVIVPECGEPLIYVDGRRLSSQSELNAIPVKEIAQIKILREPGTSYPPGTKCVIAIKLRKHLSDYASVNPSLRYTQRSRVGIAPGVAFLFSANRISGTFAATYAHSGSHPRTEQSTCLDADAPASYSQLKDSRNISNTIDLLGGLAYTINATSKLQFQYIATLKHSNRNSTDRLVLENHLTESLFNRNSHNMDNMHNLSLGYHLEFDATSLTINVAYNKIYRIDDARYSNSAQVIDIIQSPQNLNSFLSYCEFTQETPIGDFSGGYNLAVSSNKTAYTQNGIIEDSQNKTYTFAPYVGYEKAFGRITFQGALSYNYDKLQYELPNLFSKSYNIISPSLLIRYKIKRRTISIGYRDTPELPSYYELSPIKEQIDSLNYYQGNPALRYIRLHEAHINVGAFNGLSIGLSFSWRNNTVTECLVIDPNDDLTTIYTPINIGRYKRGQVNITYNLWKNNFNIYSKVAFDHTTINYPIGVGKPSSNKLSALLMLNCRYTIAGRYNIFTNSWYRSPYISTNQRIGHTLGVNLGISTSFFNRSLNVSLTASDIFNRAVSPSASTTWFGDSVRKSIFNYDGRAISLNLAYTLNNLRIKFKKSNDFDDFNTRAASRQ